MLPALLKPGPQPVQDPAEGLSCLVAEQVYIRDLKEKHCYVALDYDMETIRTSNPTYQKKLELPDGKEIILGQEAFICPEGLFNSSLLGESRIRV